MGFTPLEGIPMGTRAGSIDPGALIYLLRRGTTTDELESALERRSGLVGLAGTDDVRALERSTSKRSRLAVDLFCYRTAQAVAAMAVPLGGLDALAFTGGIGVGSAIVRARVCAQLEHLGVRVDASANAAAQGDADVATTRSSVRVVVVTSREDLVIARAARMLAAPG
jgi:acetate kinase